MRPVVPDTFTARPRKQSQTELSGATSLTESQHAATPETFFLARRNDMDASDPAASDVEVKNSTYGVQSLEETLNETMEDRETEPADGAGDSSPNTQSQNDHSVLRRMSTVRPARPQSLDLESSSHSPARRSKSRTPHDRPSSISLSPFVLGSPAEPISIPGSPKSTSTRSFRPSEEISLPDEASTHAVPSDDEECSQPPLPSQSRPQLDDNVPQLIMPSIRMPSRRPFTDRGKAMGRLKIMVSGAPGSGKTSLIKAIVQASEDIVHVDPFLDLQQKSRQSGRRHKSKPRQAKEEPSISEIYASTKPYPSWWSDLEDSRVLRRRKSLGDVVLERNLCFVDTAAGRKSRAEQTEDLVQYMMQQLLRALSAIHTVNSDLQGLLGGNGGSQVDAILYLISKETISADMECIRKLAQFSNVIPLISKADLLTAEEIASLKQSFIDKANEANIQPFLFGGAPLDTGDQVKPHAPFAVSSASTSDSETMDASILMSPDYVQPLAPSEIGFLLEKMFDQDNLNWLRHSAAKKLIQAYHLQPPTPNSPGSSLSDSQLSASALAGTTAPQRHWSHSSSINPQGYALARVADHTQREEHLAQVRLAKWAADLQRSLQNERERYESLARHERAVWLTERLSECVVDGTLIPLTETPGFPGFSSSKSGPGVVTLEGKEGQRVKYRISSTSPNDPLGLIGWNDKLKRQGWILIQVVGSVGVVGGLALWMARVWGLAPQGVSDWTCGWPNGNN
ncbi:hypothetical protein VTO42DRAFT_2716 [Malbranchea cinnamomea]